MKHYKFETSGKSDLEKDGNLLTLKANIQPWEFVQFLSTGTIQEDIQPGEVMKGLMLSRLNSHETRSLVFLNSPPYCYLHASERFVYLISCSRHLGRGRYILLFTCHVSFFFSFPRFMKDRICVSSERNISSNNLHWKKWRPK